MEVPFGELGKVRAMKVQTGLAAAGCCPDVEVTSLGTSQPREGVLAPGCPC